ncbi:uncharacterized protein LOC118004223 isoform X2 [Mirounga leonina]|uniref:uncharacterized protein LOC118004223 isoform X2 n=1 Tax=Mirounga leonina TaxID=9715 RepID=UPI00156BDD43|nr:uncharacterized protein LOC118004223 isoform X2 [Mirounga leonina]
MSGSGLPLSPCRRGLLPRSASCAGRRHGAQAAGGSGRAPGGVRTPRITRERERPPLPGKARPGKKTRKTHPKSLRQDPLSDITYKRFYRNLISPQESKSRRDQESCAGAIHITATGIFNMQGQDKHLFLIRPWDTLWLYTQLSKGTNPADTLILDFQPPEPRDNMFLLLNLPSLWRFILTVLAN